MEVARSVGSRFLPELTGDADRRPERGSGSRPSHFCCYDLDDLDVAWLELVNHEFKQMGESGSAGEEKAERAALFYINKPNQLAAKAR